jgi:hypothetical protein
MAAPVVELELEGVVRETTITAATAAGGVAAAAARVAAVSRTMVAAGLVGAGEEASTAAFTVAIP